jgi:hypothetical protein
MKIKDLELKIKALEKEIAELKKREPISTSFPATVCPLQHYPITPDVYPTQYPITWC